MTSGFSVPVPGLQQLIQGSMTSEQKFEILAFLIDDTIKSDKLQTISVEYLMHVIILVHLMSQKSLDVFEALAFTKVLKDVYRGNVPKVFILPKRIDSRALRTSFLYSKLFYILSRCLPSVGLKEFIVSLDGFQR
jgi:hypothetical protein